MRARMRIDLERAGEVLLCCRAPGVQLAAHLADAGPDLGAVAVQPERLSVSRERLARIASSLRDGTAQERRVCVRLDEASANDVPPVGAITAAPIPQPT